MDELILEIKELIVDSLNLEDITAEEIDSEEALFSEGLGLDSIDALELGMAIQKKFGIKVSAQSEDVKKHFYSAGNLARFVASQTRGN